MAAKQGPISKETESSTVRRHIKLLQQNKARHMDSKEAEKLIKNTAISSENNVRSYMKNKPAAKIKVDHDTRVTDYKRTLEGLLEDHSRASIRTRDS